MKKLLSYPVMLLFFGFVFVFSAVDMLVPPRAYSEMENRYLKQMPSFSISGLLDSSSTGFAQQFESFTNDQFVGRDGWITLKSVTESLLGKIENNGIVYGADGYLFEKYRTYDTDRLERNVSLIERFAQQYPELSIRAMVVPSAYQMLSDKVPVGLGNVDQGPLIDEIYTRFGKVGIETIDVRPILSQHADESIYYRTDHHWTTYGAYLASRVFWEQLGLRPLSLKKLTVHEVDGFYGTHYSKAKKFDIAPDVLTWYDLPVDSVTLDGEQADGMYDLDALQTRDKYAMFLYGNHGVTVIENASAPGGSLLVIKDSYANSMVPFLTQSFARVVVVDLRSLPQALSEMIGRENFSEVLILYSFSNLASDANLPRILY